MGNDNNELVEYIINLANAIEKLTNEVSSLTTRVEWLNDTMRQG